jgi:nicotinamidase/pyrazinamidase
MLLASQTLLLEIDVQNDFCPAYGACGKPGALAVAEGCAVVEPLNALAVRLASAGGRVAATQDWHPPGHISFFSSHKGKKPGDIIETEKAKEQVLWPDHCLADSWGAAFHEGLDIAPVSLIVRKGLSACLDSYSAFFENDRKTTTGLDGWIKALGIKNIILGGLATDYCVYYSAIDSLELGFNTFIAEDCVRGVNVPEGSVALAVNDMKSRGVVFASSSRLMELIE